MSQIAKTRTDSTLGGVERVASECDGEDRLSLRTLEDGDDGTKSSGDEVIQRVVDGEDPSKDSIEPRHGKWKGWKKFEFKGEVKRNEEETRYLYAQVASRCLRSAKQTRRVYRIQQTLSKHSQIPTIGAAYASRSRPFAMYLFKSI